MLYLPVIAAALLAAAPANPPAAAPAKPRPDFNTVRTTVQQQLAKLPEYRPGQVLVRGEVDAVLKQLQRVGWTVPHAQRLLEQVPGDDEEWIQALRTPEGRKFMDQIARYPQAYDRLDRWSRLNGGMREVRATIHGPDGYKLVEYMTTTSGGKNMGQMLSNAPRGEDFNRPTGRMYTESDLLARLKTLYGEPAKKK